MGFLYLNGFPGESEKLLDTLGLLGELYDERDHTRGGRAMQAARVFAVCLTLAAGLTLMFDPAQAQPEEGNQEAQEQAENFFYAFLTKCGDSYYVQDISHVSPPPSPSPHPLAQPIEDVGIMTLELKSPQIALEPDELTDADKLHGIEWQGMARFSVRSRAHFQKKSPQRASDQAGWSEWQEDMREAPWLGSAFPRETQLRKKNGQWFIDPLGSYGTQKTVKHLKSVPCNDIPK
jgi:hypothetical protein